MGVFLFTKNKYIYTSTIIKTKVDERNTDQGRD